CARHLPLMGYNKYYFDYW
nr:immunoglobulin heavy chain junction region [Macaca mulatta]MOW96176.1 immunoglobulin heavy chain junction region [Macaca mulatta]MOW97202.1 immunoglobulin heavy chain junction region [Macaca mulatta]MOW97384.1 immunoglobulin heavy chain junction region [Macaca mulatta]MOW97776.1 immunoglobulin heavy chain junction region [Macaca mulatta]